MRSRLSILLAAPLGILSVMASAQTDLPAGAIVIEAHKSGQNNAMYTEEGGPWADTATKPGAAGLTATAGRSIASTGVLFRGAAVFTPVIATAGTYEVQISYPESANVRNVTFTAKGLEGVTLRAADMSPAGAQGSRANTWVTIGNAPFPAGSAVSILASGERTEGPMDAAKPYEFSIAAMRFVPREAAGEAKPIAVTAANPFDRKPEATPAPVATKAAEPIAEPAKPVGTPGRAPAAGSGAMVADPFSAATTGDIAGAAPDPAFKASGAPSAGTGSGAAVPENPFGEAGPAPTPAPTPAATPEATPATSGLPRPGGQTRVADPFSAAPMPDASAGAGMKASPAGVEKPVATPAAQGANPFEGGATPAPAAGALKPEDIMFKATPDTERVEPSTAPPRPNFDALTEGGGAVMSTAPSLEGLKPTVEKPETSLAAALSRATSERKPVIAIFYAETGAFRSFNESILENKDVKPLLSRGVPLTVNIRQDRDTARKFSVRRAPYVVVLDPRGFTKAHIAEARSSARFVKALGEALQ